MLGVVTATLLVLTLAHDADHVRQGRALAIELYGVALAALAMLTITLVLLRRRHPFADIAAATVGLSTVVGVASVHVAPARPFLSDSYGAAGADALSWAIVVLMMCAGLAMAVLALLRLRAAGGRRLRHQ